MNIIHWICKSQCLERNEAECQCVCPRQPVYGEIHLFWFESSPKSLIFMRYFLGFAFWARALRLKLSVCYLSLSLSRLVRPVFAGFVKGIPDSIPFRRAYTLTFSVYCKLHPVNSSLQIETRLKRWPFGCRTTDGIRECFMNKKKRKNYRTHTGKQPRNASFKVRSVNFMRTI